MNRLAILDAGPAGLASKSPGRPGADACHAWIEALKAAGTDLAVAAVARYEVRRELFRIGAVGALGRLDRLHPGMALLPVTDEVLDVASELWASARRAGLPTAADDRLDADAILAATALVEAGSGREVLVATTNVAHLARFPGVDARNWWEIT